MTQQTDVLVTPLRRIPTAGGDVRHGMKATDPGFAGFGEAYFSQIDPGAIKGWKQHQQMVLNFVAGHGLIQVSVRYENGTPAGDYLLGPDTEETYVRLTIPPRCWVAFGGAGSQPGILLNLASIGHDPTESRTVGLEEFPWTWLAER